MNINVEQYLQLQDLENMKDLLSEEEFALRCLLIIYNCTEEELNNINIDEEDLIGLTQFNLETDDIELYNVKINNKILFFTDCNKIKNEKYFTIKQYHSDLDDERLLFLITLSVLVSENNVEYSDKYFRENIKNIKKIDIRYALKQYQQFINFDLNIFENYKILFETDFDDKYRNRGYKIPDNFNVVATLDRLTQGDITKLEEVNNMSTSATFAFLAYWGHKDKRINSINKMREKE